MRRPYVRHASAVASERLVHSETDSSLARFIPRGTARRRVGRPARRRLFLGSRRLGKRRASGRVNRPPPPPTRPQIRRGARETSPRGRRSRPPLLGHLRLLLRRRAPSPRLFSLRLRGVSTGGTFADLRQRGIEPVVAPKPASPTPGRAGADAGRAGRIRAVTRVAVTRFAVTRVGARAPHPRPSRFSSLSRLLFFVVSRRFPITDAHLEGETRAGWSCAGCSSSTRPGTDAHARDRVRVLDAERQRDSPSTSPSTRASNLARGPPVTFAFRSRDRLQPRAHPPRRRIFATTAKERPALLRRRERGVAFALFRAAVARRQRDDARADTRRRRRRERARGRLPQASRPRRTTRSAARGSSRREAWRRVERARAVGARGLTDASASSRRRRGNRAGASRRDDGGRCEHARTVIAARARGVARSRRSVAHLRSRARRARPTRRRRRRFER